MNVANILYNIIPANFLKNASVLFLGSAISQVMAFFALLFLTRLYEPSAFGRLEVFLAIGSFLTVLANFRLESIIGLVHEHKEANNVLMLCILSNIIFFFLTSIFCFFSFKIFKTEDIYMLLPFYIFTSAFSESFKYYQFRQERYSNVTYFRNIKVLFIFSFCFIFAGFGFSQYGLILGNLFGEMIAAISLAKMCKNFSFKDYSFDIIMQIYRKHRVLTQVLFSSQIIEISAAKIPSFFISIVGSKEELGYYSICRLILTAPAMIAENIGSIYRQEAIRENHRYGKFSSCFSLYFLIISLFAGVIFSLLFFGGHIILNIVVGRFVDGIEPYFYILLISSFFGFLTTPLDKGAQIAGAKRYIFFWTVSRASTIIFGSFLFYELKLGILEYLVFLVVSQSFYYVYDLVYEYHLSFGNKKRMSDITPAIN
ncbi:MAG: oligosaccharide flippase family protein [Alphaproteobacteria bacterium]|nr:oligosaccharide flippase family protein [Alphaproteobacteria bacterium]